MFSAALLMLTVAQPPMDLSAALRAHHPRLASLVEQPRENRFHLLLGEPVEDEKGRVTLRRTELGDPRQYFYPASSIKTAGAIAALLELQRLSATLGASLGLDSRLRIGTLFDGDVAAERDASNVDGGDITVGHEIRKLFLVSDNVAFNRCYELVGHRGLNEWMWRGGFASCRVLHRLSEFRSVDEQRRTRPCEVSSGGDSWHGIEARDSELVLDNDDLSDCEAGEAHYARGVRVAAPLSFREKNSISVRDLQDMLAAVVRPEIATGKRGFPELSVRSRAFLCRAMSELPRASKNPVYAAAEYPDHYAKFFLPGVARVVPASRLRIYNKIGRAYGFSIDNAYIEDAATGRGFFLTAVIYTNPNATLNDDDYGYAELADPVLADLGEVAARYVFGREPQAEGLSLRGRK